MLELEPCFSARTPSKEVSDEREVLRVERSVPRLLRTVSCACRAASWVFQGVSIACCVARMAVTVVATSKPVPLVAEPKFNPTVPMMGAPCVSLSVLPGLLVTGGGEEAARTYFSEQLGCHCALQRMRSG
jgi:hypothetical protein